MGSGGYNGGSTIIRGPKPKVSKRAKKEAARKAHDTTTEQAWLSERGLTLRRKPPNNGARKPAK